MKRLKIAARSAGIGALVLVASGLAEGGTALSVLPDGSCTECLACTGGEHRAPANPLGSLSSIHAYCINTLCSHPGCNPSSAPDLRAKDLALNAEIRNAAQNDEDALGRLLSDHSDRLVLNVRRQALQVTNCNGTALIAHLPLSSKQLASLDTRGLTRAE